MSRRADLGSVTIVLALTLAVDRVVDVPLFVALLVAGVAFEAAKVGFERVVDALEGDQDERRDEPIGAREARAAYVADEIGVDELEDRLDRALDPNVRAIVERYEQADDVGRRTCEKLGDTFGTVESIEKADPNELEQVDGIGPERAAAIANN
jgi:hypothetical protein